MHNLLRKVTLWGLAGTLAVGLFAFPNTARQVDAKGGYASSKFASNGAVRSVATLPPIPSGQTKLVGIAASWNFYAHGKSPGSNWMKPGSSTTGWSAGIAPLGYGNGSSGQATKVPFGGDQNNRYVTTYFRRGFSVSDPSSFTSLTVQLLHDDGAVVYLNGTAISHPNMSSSTPSYSTLASGCNSGVVETFNILPSLLVAGRNMLAVEIHQCAKNSANLIFNASLYGKKNTEEPDTPSSGTLPEAPSGKKWVYRWGDEFNGTSIDTSMWKIDNKTRPEDPNKTYYIPQNASVSNGSLKLTVKRQSYSGANYTGAMLESTGNYRRNRYGYYEARIKYNLVGPGFWTNFWMCGVDKWPPEFDNEVVTGRPGAIFLANHYKNSSGVDQSSHTFYPVDYNQWHTYGVL